MTALIMDSVLKSKIQAPLIQAPILEIKTLQDQLDHAFDYPVILLTAPAGYGKTTQVAHYLKQSKRTYCWLTLEASENDPHRFLLYLIATIEALTPPIDGSLADQIQSANPPRADWLMACLINRLADMEEVTLVIDDWHVIYEDPVHQLMDQLMTHLPPQVTLVLMTRVYPMLSLNSLRLKHALFEVFKESLTLSTEEAETFLKIFTETIPESPNENDFHRAIVDMEGWIAGLKIYGLFLRDHKMNDQSKWSTPDTIERTGGDNWLKNSIGLGSIQNAFSHHLFSNLFQTLTEEEQVTLMISSVPNRFSVSLCNDLLNDLGHVLQETFFSHLVKQGHFILEDEDSGHWYKYHPLYKEFLQTRLAQWVFKGSTFKGQPHRVTLQLLNERAAKAFIKLGLEVEAFEMAAQSDNIPLTLSILHGGDTPLLYRGTLGLAIRWIEQLSETKLQENPWLWVLLASAKLSTGHSTQIEHYIGHALQGITQYPIESLPESFVKQQDIVIATLRASVAVIHHRIEDIEGQATRALALMGCERLPARPPALWALGYAKLLRRHWSDAQVLFEEAVLLSQGQGNALVEIMATINCGNVYEEQNFLNEAEKYYLKVLNRPDHMGYPVSCDAYLGLARVYLDQNKLHLVKDHIEIAKLLSNQIDVTDRKALCYEMEARLLMAKHQPQLAFGPLEEGIRVLMTEKFYHRLESFYELQCQLLLITEHKQAAQSICSDRKLNLCTIQLLRHNHQLIEAVEALDTLKNQEPYIHWPKAQIGLHLSKAICLYQMSEGLTSKTPHKKNRNPQDVLSTYLKYHAQAKSELQQALKMAQFGHIIRPFLECGLPGELLIRQIEETEGPFLYPSFVAQLKEALMADSSKLNITPLEPLSQREVEILQLIAEGMSNEAIADQLHIALSTVKGTNQRIFSKLLVKRRTEAIIKGKQLGYIR